MPESRPEKKLNEQAGKPEKPLTKAQLFERERLRQVAEAKRKIAEANAAKEDTTQVEELRKSLGVKSPEAEKREEERVVEKVLQDGGFVLYTHLPGGYLDRTTNTQYYAVADKRSERRTQHNRTGTDTPWGAIEGQFGARDLGSHRTSMEKMGINEFIDIRKETTARVRQEIIPGKKPILGLFGGTQDKKGPKIVEYTPVRHEQLVAGGSKENAVRFTYFTALKPDYIDDNGRPKKDLVLSLILPESSANLLETAIDKDPAVMRKILERAAKEKILKSPDDWEKPMGRGTAIRPPYEAWDLEPESGGRVYVQKDRAGKVEGKVCAIKK